jgi:hypothetical protein
MKQFNITAQVYKLSDPYKQTILHNKEINADSAENATNLYHKYMNEYKVVKIYSVEELFISAA